MRRTVLAPIVSLCSKTFSNSAAKFKPWQRSPVNYSNQFIKLPNLNYNGTVVTSLREITTTSLNLSCWKCGSNATPTGNGIVRNCSKCKALQQLEEDREDVNYFKLFGLQETYRIDVSELSKKMKLLQRSLHPDLFSMKSKEEQTLSDELSSMVNKAFAVLQNPMERAEYLLKLKGIDSHQRERQVTMDSEFLMTVMELNEKVEEIKDTGDLESFRKDNNEMLRKLDEEFDAAMNAEDINDAVLVVSKMKYYNNVQEKLKLAQARLGVID